MTTTKKIKELAAGEVFKLRENAKKIWAMGYPNGMHNYKKEYHRHSNTYGCVPCDDVLSGGREFKADQIVFTDFEY